jgi:putative endopeptidase
MTTTPCTGLTPADLDSAVRPQDDLFRHVNGTWLRDYEIPADRAIDGGFRALADLSEERVKAIIEDLAATASTAGGNAAKIGALYASFMDVDRINELGYSPIADELALIGSIGSVEGLTEALGLIGRVGGAGAFAAGVDNDAHDPTVYRLHLWQGGLGLPDEAYYREDAHAEIRTKYVEHVARMLSMTGVVPAPRIAPIPGQPFPVMGAAKDAAEAVLALETKIASHHWDVVRAREATEIYNPMTFDEFAASAPGIDWVAWREIAEIPENVMANLVVCQPSFFTGFAELWASEPIASWKLWMAYHLVSKRAAYLTEAIVEANFDFYGRTLSGTPELRERWKRGVAFVEGAMGEAVGEQYVARHFPPVAKERMDVLVANLVEAYRKSIEALPWMGAETKVKALDKLSKFTPKIGYPVKWRDYSTLVVDENLIENVKRSFRFEVAIEFAKIGKPIDRDEWFMTPQTVNAYYNPGMNEIVFPAAILQPPFFSADADDAVNYGGIGAVIGHEIGHGFDDQGSQYDGDGKLENWWTDEDRAGFEERTKALIAQYDALIPLQLGPDGPHVNGAFTIGENIGDVAGLAIAIKAYALSLGGSLDAAPVIDGMTGIERVFHGWAQAWKTKGRDEIMIQRIATDPHSPAEFRCNQVVKNIDEFHAAFATSEGDGMWMAPAERVHIW